MAQEMGINQIHPKNSKSLGLYDANMLQNDEYCCYAFANQLLHFPETQMFALLP